MVSYGKVWFGQVRFGLVMFGLLWVELGRFGQVWFKINLFWTLTKIQTYAWAWALLFATQDICVAVIVSCYYAGLQCESCKPAVGQLSAGQTLH